MILLGIDYGQSRLGLAIAVNSIISPYKTLKNQGTEKTIAEVYKICNQENVDRVVLGIPEGELVPEIKRFGKSLKKMVRLPVIKVNEVMTSWEAKKKLGKVKDKGRIDQIAAVLILQRYLDRN